MTILGHLVGWFSALQLLTAGLCLWQLGRTGSVGWLSAAVAAVYVLPIVAYRLQSWWRPLRPGFCSLAAPTYHPWWGAYHFQRLFVAFPALEAALRLVPGLFSMWLRVWGSRIGKRVHWTPQLDLLDRTHLEIGDEVVLGHRVTISCHIVRRKGPRLTLYVAPVTVGPHAFVGAGTVLAPGVVIDEGVALEAGTHVHPRRRVTT